MNRKEQQLLEAILAKVNAIADAFGIDDPSEAQTFTENSNLNFSPANLLPPELKVMLKDEAAFAKAFSGEKPLLYFRNGKIVTSITKKNLYGYFLGRMFCGDYPMRLGPKTIWKGGTENFPDAALFRTFDQANVRQSRQNQLNHIVPIGHEIIDMLFVI